MNVEINLFLLFKVLQILINFIAIKELCGPQDIWLKIMLFDTFCCSYIWMYFTQYLAKPFAITSILQSFWQQFLPPGLPIQLDCKENNSDIHHWKHQIHCIPQFFWPMVLCNCQRTQAHPWTRMWKDLVPYSQPWMLSFIQRTSICSICSICDNVAWCDTHHWLA